MWRRCRIIVAVAVLLFGLCNVTWAQFRENAFSQSYNDDKTSSKDSIDVLFSFKDYFAGLSHKKEIKIGTSFAGSWIFLGGQQIYNKQYWKLPIVYGTTLGALGTGIAVNMSGNHDGAKYWFIGAGVAYWATLFDGAMNYKPAPFPTPGRATIMSLLLPGLGQIYNHEYWKVPIYVGGLAAAFHFYSLNNLQFQRYRRIYIEATDPEVPYTGPIPAERALYYRNIYRSYRDYSLVAIIGVYLLQVIDANVFAYMHDFEVKDDLAVKLSPTVIVPDNQIAYSSSQSPALGVRFGLTF